MPLLGPSVLPTALWDNRYYLNLRQNCSKNKLVGENEVTGVHGSCLLSRVMVSCANKVYFNLQIQFCLAFLR